MVIGAYLSLSSLFSEVQLEQVLGGSCSEVNMNKCEHVPEGGLELILYVMRIPL